MWEEHQSPFIGPLLGHFEMLFTQSRNRFYTLLETLLFQGGCGRMTTASLKLPVSTACPYMTARIHALFWYPSCSWYLSYLVAWAIHQNGLSSYSFCRVAELIRFLLKPVQKASRVAVWIAWVSNLQQPWVNHFTLVKMGAPLPACWSFSTRSLEYTEKATLNNSQDSCWVLWQ